MRKNWTALNFLDLDDWNTAEDPCPQLEREVTNQGKGLRQTPSSAKRQTLTFHYGREGNFHFTRVSEKTRDLSFYRHKNPQSVLPVWDLLVRAGYQKRWKLRPGTWAQDVGDFVVLGSP